MWNLFIFLIIIIFQADAQGSDNAPHEWYISRDMWLAPEFINQNAVTEFAPLKLVIVTHTVSPACNVFVSCAAEIRNLQSFYTSNHGYDLPYNFLIGNDGRVYEGRGWNRICAYAFEYNRCTLGIAFIGDYRELPSSSKVTEMQLLRAKMLLDRGVKLGYLQRDYHVVGMKDLMSTLSPGSNLYRAIQLWPSYDHENLYRGKTCEQIYNRSENQTSVVV